MPGVLDGASLDVAQGELYTLMGLDASGRTTLASIIAAVKMQESGVVEVHGK